MTKEVVKKIVRGITDKIECNTADIDDWAEFWGFTIEEYEEFLDTAIKVSDQEPCEDAISRSDMLDAVGHGATYTSEDLQKIIKALPPVNPQPKIGRWIAYEVGLPDRTILNYRCSVCGRKLIGYNTETLSEVPFCHCGAKMVDSQEGEEKE